MSDANKESAADFGEGEAAKAARYIAEIEASEKYWGPYWQRCKRINTRYEQAENAAEDGKANRGLNILWPNIETLKPATYAKVPAAVVLRRNNDSDPVARIASEVLERAVNFSIDAYDFDQVLKNVRDEFLLLAKGQVWVRYVPTFEEAVQSPSIEQGADAPKAEKGKPTAQAPPEPPAERLKYEEVICDYVVYDDFGTNAARNWQEVRLLWRKAYLGRPKLKKRFKKKLPNSDVTVGGAVPLDWKAAGSTEKNTDEFGKAVVYEVWDLEAKKVVWISKSFPNAPLDERDDPLELTDFWPCPKPALGTTSLTRIIPTPDFVYYQDQADELNDLTKRIDVLTKAVRMVGLFAGDQKVNLANVFKGAAENEMIAVDSWQTWIDKGGIKGMIDWVPVDKVIQVLEALYKARDLVMALIYQQTGISDIMRGDTDPGETAAAQGLKSTWGSSRVRDKQKEIARFCRDIFRITGEIIAKRFSINTIRQMTNIQLFTQAEKTAAQAAVAAHQQQAAAAAQAQQQPPPAPLTPDQQRMLELPTWEEVDQLLKSDGLRNFRIDIEADSTVEPDLMNDKRDATEFATAFGGLIGVAMPAVQAAPPLGKVIGAFAKNMARKFNAGREIEDIIDKAMDEIAGLPPTPPPGQEKQGGKSPEELALEQEKNAIAREKVGVERENAKADAATNAAGVQAEMMRTQSDERIAMLEATVRRMEAIMNASAQAAPTRQLETV